MGHLGTVPGMTPTLAHHQQDVDDAAHRAETARTTAQIACLMLTGAVREHAGAPTLETWARVVQWFAAAVEAVEDLAAAREELGHARHLLTVALDAAVTGGAL